ILGPGLLEGLVGPSREFARRWAVADEYALAPYQQEDLPRVLQFLAVREGRKYPLNKFAERLRIEALKRFRPDPTAAEAPTPQGTADSGAVDRRAKEDPARLAAGLLEATLAEARRWQREKNHVEPHGILAQLPFPIYLTTNPETLLEHSLADAGKPF